MFLKNKCLLAAAAAFTAALAMSTQPAMAGTVVAVSGPSASTYPVGAQIGDTQRVTLQQGDSLTVLDGGGTRVLRGPGTFTLARQSGRARNSAFSALTRQRSATRARTGAVRTGDDGLPPSNPNLWYVNVASSGKICLPDPTQVRLWRSDTAAETVYTISAVAAPQDAVDVTFRESEMLAGWDARIALNEGLIYSIESTDMPASSVNFLFLDNVPGDAEGLAQTLIANGCTNQLELLSAAMAEE